MGQRVNPILYRSGISSYWGSVNFPSNKNLSSITETNYLFDLVKIYFRRRGLKLYNQKCKISKCKIRLYLYFYENRFIPDKFKKKTFKFKKKTFKFKQKKPKKPAPKNLKFLNFKFYIAYNKNKNKKLFLKSPYNINKPIYKIKKLNLFNKINLKKNINKETNIKSLCINIKKTNFGVKQFKSFSIAKRFMRLKKYKFSRKKKRKKKLRH